MHEDGRPAFEELLSFLDQLTEVHAWHVLTPVRAETVAVVVRHPGQFWEVEFEASGEVHVERFVSPGVVSHDETLLDDFIIAWRDDEAQVPRLYAKAPAVHTTVGADCDEVYPAFEKLLDFLEGLEEAGAPHIRTLIHPGSLAVISELPLQYWEFEFFPGGRVGIERYESRGVGHDDDGRLRADFIAAQGGDPEAAARLDVYPPFEGRWPSEETEPPDPGSEAGL